MDKDTRNFDLTFDKRTKRSHGLFYTPEVWANESHKRISELLGDDWKEKYVVWDPACGT